MTDIVQRLYPSGNVTVLTDANFELSGEFKISLSTISECCLILFYIENDESKQLLELWSKISKSVPEPKFASVNLIYEKGIASAINFLQVTQNHPLHSFGLRQYPFIFVYRERYPVACYNGTRSYNNILDYALSLACKGDYHEPYQLGVSAQLADNSKLPGYAIYSNIDPNVQIRKTSVEYTSDSYLRGFGAPQGVPNPPTQGAPNVQQGVPNPQGVPNVQQGVPTQTPQGPPPTIIKPST